MAERVTLYVPTTGPGSEAIIDIVRGKFSKRFGGATVITDARGSWVSEEMERVVDDSVAIVMSTSEDGVDRDFASWVANMVEDYLDEESVMYEIEDTEVYFT